MMLQRLLGVAAVAAALVDASPRENHATRPSVAAVAVVDAVAV